MRSSLGSTSASPTNESLAPYLQSSEQVARVLKVVPSRGLSSQEVTRRRTRDGTNTIPLTREHPLWRLLGDRLKDFLVIFLLAAALISLFLGELADAIIIAIAIALDATLSFAQVWRTERTLANLRQKVEQMTTVIRDGKAHSIPASYLVVGDVIVFRAGEKIPADARLIAASGLQISEAALTGEAHDVKKHTARLQSRTPIANRANMVHLSTTVSSGSGRAIVTAIGTRTEFGRIAQMLKTQVSPASPLRKKLQHNAQVIGWIILILVAVITVVGLLQGRPLADTLRTAITLIVSAIPEDLTVILTVALTVGVIRILRQHGVVRELSSGESLGAATVICTDKTGTLTQGKMDAQAFDCLQGSIVSPDQPPRDPLHALALTGLVLATDAHRLTPDTPEYFGSATERVALGFAERLGFSQPALRSQWRLRDSIAFSSDWKYRASLHDHPTQNVQVLFVIGAPEVLLHKSTSRVNSSGDIVPLTIDGRQELTDKIQDHAARGERLLAVAVNRHYPGSDITHADIKGLSFLGILIITDPIRLEVRDSIAQTHAAGVAVKLITGDLTATAQAVARDVGLTVSEDAVCTGTQLQDMTDEELRDVVERTVIFARVNPLDKQRIIRALQDRGHVVAMTGDGVNDAVALKSADIGVAMGSGKDIAKDAADLILLDDNFTTIVHAIREGRVIRDNVRKVIAFLLSTNVAEVALFLISVAMRWPLPLLPAQILWINLVTDGTSDLALSVEPDERNVMRRRPEDPHAPLLNKHLLAQIGVTGAIMTAVAVSLYWYLWQHLSLDVAYAQTMIFTFIAVCSLLSTWSFRSLTESLYRRGLWQNPWILVSAGFSFILQLAAVYVPALQRLFGTVPLNAHDWMIIIGLSAIAVLLIDLRKIVLAPHRARRQSGVTSHAASLAR